MGRKLFFGLASNLSQFVRRKAKRLSNNYLEVAWEIDEMCPKTRSYYPLIKKKIISTPSHIDNIKANPLSLETKNRACFIFLF